MRIVLVSDSHGYPRAIGAVLELVGDFDAVFHAGDGCRDLARVITAYPDKAFYAVCGNCDGAGAYLNNKPISNDEIIDTPKGKILLTHGHLYGVKSGLEALYSASARAGVFLCVHGHTHIPHVEKSGAITVVCPGSCAFPKETRYPTYGVINIEGESIDVAVVEITPFGARPV